jgi:nitrate reductase NapE component
MFSRLISNSNNFLAQISTNKISIKVLSRRKWYRPFAYKSTSIHRLYVTCKKSSEICYQILVFQESTHPPNYEKNDMEAIPQFPYKVQVASHADEYNKAWKQEVRTNSKRGLQEKDQKVGDMEYACWLRFMLLAVCLFPALVQCRVRHYKFNVSIILL